MALSTVKFRIEGLVDGPTYDMLEVLYTFVVPGDHYEKIYPWDSVGVSVVAGNLAWGSVVVIIPTDTLTADYGWTGGGDLVDYVLNGFKIASSANPANTNTYQIFRVDITTLELLNATSGFGEANPDRIQIADTSGFLAADIIWVMDDASPNGEVATVDSIVVNDYLDTDTNFANAYTVAGNAKVYLIRRLGDGDAHRTIWGKFSSASVKESHRFMLHAPRHCHAGDGLIARAYGLEGASTMYLTAILHTTI